MVLTFILYEAGGRHTTLQHLPVYVHHTAPDVLVLPVLPTCC